MKTQIFNAKGEKGKEIMVPSFFHESVRTDLIQRIVDGTIKMQPYGPSLIAGNQSSASGSLKHHRKVWKSQYGRGMSRIPRKTMSRRGSQFNWVGAVVPNTRGGRRAHPPKSYATYENALFNKKEILLALKGALSASVNPKWLQKRYETLKGEKIENAFFVVEGKFVEEKMKDKLIALKKILGETLFPLSIKTRTTRAGKGKNRGRRYKSSLGMLFVIGKNEKMKTTAFDVISADKVGVSHLAVGGPGRITIYSEEAIKELTKRIVGEKQ